LIVKYINEFIKKIADRIIMKIIIIIIIGIFILGYSIGSNAIPFDDTIKAYYSKLTAPNYYEQNSDQILPILYQTNVQSLIHIDDETDITKIRNQIIDYVWKEDGFSKTKMPSKIEQNIQDERYYDIINLEKIDKITLTMEYGVESHGYIFVAEEKNNDFVFYHQGHDGDFINGKKTIEFFLEKGYSVVAFSMPLLGMNNQPTVNVENIGVIKLTGHEHFRLLDSDDFSSIKFFLEPIMVAVNYIENNYNSNSIFMVGISGGGWTTTMYSAIDDRIDKSFPVGAMLPLFISLNAPAIPHYESVLLELYKKSSYLDLYILGSFGEGREQIKIINKFASCSHGGISYQVFAEEIIKTMEKLNNGKFSIFLDDSHNRHKISDTALQVILQNIRN
jgi:hypothetical protein